MRMETKKLAELDCLYLDLERTAAGPLGFDAPSLERFLTQALKSLPPKALLLAQEGLVFHVDPLPALFSGALDQLRLTACLPLASGHRSKRPVLSFPPAEVLAITLDRAQPVELAVRAAMEQCRRWVMADPSHRLGAFARLHVYPDGRRVLCVERRAPLD